MNALEIVGKKIDKVRVVFCGGGAAAIACANLYLNLGVRRENIIMCDSKGVIYKGRKEGMNPYKERYAVETDKRTIAQALEGADAFVGVSVKDGISAEMVKKMAKDPIIFAMANPDPEVLPEEVLKVRPDAIMATGRSDYPNQVNNVLGFPFIFRGALDTGAIGDQRRNENGGRQGARSARQRRRARKRFSRLRRAEIQVRPRVSDSEAFRSPRASLGRARRRRSRDEVRRRAQENRYRPVSRSSRDSARHDLHGHARDQEARQSGASRRAAQLAKIVLPEGESSKILRAAQIMREEGIAEPILLGNDQTDHEQDPRSWVSKSSSRAFRSSVLRRAICAMSMRRNSSKSASARA